MSIQSVGAYEAKTHLPHLLRQVQAGKVFDISVRGQVVARLSSVTSAQQHEAAAAKMRAFMQAQQLSAVGEGLGLGVRELIDEGRA